MSEPTPLPAIDGDCVEVRGRRVHRLVVGDAGVLPLADGSVDLVFGSPPYEDRRTYGIGYTTAGDDWVRWAADRFEEACRVSRGLVAFVVDGKTSRFRYSCAPEKLIVELDRRGVSVRRPAYYSRWGIPGSGGPDYLKARAETIVVGQRTRGRLPWADPTACGWEPKQTPGGPPSHRLKNGRRVDFTHTNRLKDKMARQGYTAPKRANPGNIIDCGAVGGGNIGHPLASENEAPFPLALAAFFVRTFCPPGGTVLDPFIGSGTTAHAAEQWGRDSIGVDVRESQIDLARRRLGAVVGTE